ncbi:MAG TPA: hypothetical protein GXX36_07205 [Clostridiaceae bacterium]|nr:hypothetical protein [Clostridiaceae bacterium]
MDNMVSVRQRLEELKSYVYNELNLLKMQIRKANYDNINDGSQKLLNCDISNKTSISDIEDNPQNMSKRERHMRSYSRVKKGSGRKYKRV